MSDIKIEELIRYWVEGAAEDLESARSVLFVSSRIGPALFYLHLSLEKALKAKYVLCYQSHAPYTHNLLVLIEKLNWTPSVQQIEELAEINQFNMIGRYPDTKNTIRNKFTSEYAHRYFKIGEDLWNWISNH